MKYQCFEDLPVWKDAIELAVRVFALTANPVFKSHSGTRNQLENSTVSISNNIAEGFERGTTQETLTFLYISRGSCGETRSMFRLLERLQSFREVRDEIKELIPRSISISRQLRAWADSLQNTDIRGQRYLNDRSRQREKEIKDRNDFLEELKRIREGKGSTTKTN